MNFSRCVVCGLGLSSSSRADRKTCSPACRTRLHRSEQTPDGARLLEDVSFPARGRTRSRAPRATGECLSCGRDRHPRGGDAVLEAHELAEGFYQPWEPGRARFCSATCSGRWYRAQRAREKRLARLAELRAEWAATPAPTRFCRRCGGPIPGDHPARFCGAPCARADALAIAKRAAHELDYAPGTAPPATFKGGTL